MKCEGTYLKLLSLFVNKSTITDTDKLQASCSCHTHMKKYFIILSNMIVSHLLVNLI